jgi:hypothetical protein
MGDQWGTSPCGAQHTDGRSLCWIQNSCLIIWSAQDPCGVIVAPLFSCTWLVLSVGVSQWKDAFVLGTWIPVSQWKVTWLVVASLSHKERDGIDDQLLITGRQHLHVVCAIFKCLTRSLWNLLCVSWAQVPWYTYQVYQVPWYTWYVYHGTWAHLNGV